MLACQHCLDELPGCVPHGAVFGLEVKQIEVAVLHDMGFCGSDENEQPGCVPLRAVFVPPLIGSEAGGDSFAT